MRCAYIISIVAAVITMTACTPKEDAQMKIDAPLAGRLAKATEAESISVIITLERPGDLDAVVKKSGIRIDNAFENIPAVSASVPPAKVRELAALPQVTRIELDSEAHASPKPGSD
jgi:hypothetical protein